MTVELQRDKPSIQKVSNLVYISVGGSAIATIGDVYNTLEEALTNSVYGDVWVFDLSQKDENGKCKHIHLYEDGIKLW